MKTRRLALLLVAGFAVGVCSAWAQSYTWTTLAGTPGSSGSGDSASTSARFNRPQGVAVDSNGNVFVADVGNSTIRRISPEGVVTTLAGSAGNSGTVDGTGRAARFGSLSWLTVDRAGNLFASGFKIRRITSEGVVTTLNATAVTGLAVDERGTLFCTDAGRNIVFMVTEAGVVSTFAGAPFTFDIFGSSGPYYQEYDGAGSRAVFLQPIGIAVDGGGNLFVADQTGSTIRKITPAGVVTTLAGTTTILSSGFFQPGVSSRGSADGTGIAARFSGPTGVAVDNRGNVFVTDTGNHTIRRITASGSVTTLAGRAGSSGTADGVGSAARFNGPTGVAVDAAGNVFVADTGSHTIRKITATGVVTTLAGVADHTGSADNTGGTVQFNRPTGVAVDASGNVLVADAGNHTIRKITTEGVTTTFAGSAGSTGRTDGPAGQARFSVPGGLYVDSDGNVIVDDNGHVATRKITADGVVTTLTHDLSNPAQLEAQTSVAFDRAGNRYVAEYWTHTIRKITPDGTSTTFAGRAGIAGSADGTAGTARFNTPYGVAVDDGGNIFVADSGNHTLRKITASGIVITVGGLAGVLGSTDAANTAARFNGPIGIAVADNGVVYVADTGNHTIRVGVPSLTPVPIDVPNVAPVIVEAPRSQHITAGAEAIFVASVTGVDLTYQWSKNGIEIPGATSPALRIRGVTTEDMGFYSLAVSSSHSTLMSPVAILTVDIARADEYFMVTTLAGLGGRAGSADGTGNAAGFDTPLGVATDRSGNVYVADTSNHSIRKVSPSGAVATIAGFAGQVGSADGIGSAARFRYPAGVAVDESGTLYVADSGNSTIRSISPAGVVTTVAGQAQVPDSIDGPGDVARFRSCRGVAVDGSGKLLVADSGNHTIRRIDRAGRVTSLAGAPGSSGNTDGTGIAARFHTPYGVTIDTRGLVYVADTGNYLIRTISEAGVVTTMAGRAGMYPGSADGPASTARFSDIYGVAVDRSGNVFIADRSSHTIRKISPGGLVSTIAGLAGSAGSADGIAQNARFQYPVGLATDLNGHVYVADAGNHTIRKLALAAAQPPSRLVNLSTRGLVPTGGALTLGFVLRGGGKSLLVRAIGPTLGAFAVPGALANPALEVFAAGSGRATSTNDDWGGGASLANAFAAAGAFPLPVASKDAAVLVTLPAAAYSARIASTLSGDAGIALAEVYDRDAPGAAGRLINLSTLGFAGAGTHALAPGFVIAGAAPKQVLIRVVGPGLAPFGVADALADPQLAVIPLGQSFTVASNDNWGGSVALAAAFAQAGAFALPAASKDAALLVRLPPGGYTVTVTGAGGTTGTALVEIYDLDP